MTATTGTARPQPRRDHDGHGHDRIQRNVPARYHTTRQNTIAQTFQRCTMQQTPPWGSVPPAQKQGRLLSSADAECSLEHFWITCYSRSLHIFSGCNRCCTLHIVYNVPWIDVDGGEASLSHINVWPSTHTGSVRILDAVRSAVRPVYPGRGLYGLVPIILGWSAILLAQFWLSGSIPEVCSFASLCIAAIAAVCKTVTLIRRWFESTTGH